MHLFDGRLGQSSLTGPSLTIVLVLILVASTLQLVGGNWMDLIFRNLIHEILMYLSEKRRTLWQNLEADVKVKKGVLHKIKFSLCSSCITAVGGLTML